VGSEYISIDLGNPLPLELLLSDGDATKFPQAIVRDIATGTPVAGSPFDLTHLGEGLYRYTSFTPTATGNFRAVFIVYEEVGHTTESVAYPRSTDSFEVRDKLLTFKKFIALS